MAGTSPHLIQMRAFAVLLELYLCFSPLFFLLFHLPPRFPSSFLRLRSFLYVFVRPIWPACKFPFFFLGPKPSPLFVFLSSPRKARYLFNLLRLSRTVSRVSRFYVFFFLPVGPVAFFFLFSYLFSFPLSSVRQSLE